MIKLSIIESSDLLQTGSFSFEFNEIQIGSSLDCHIVLEREGVLPFHVSIYEEDLSFSINCPNGNIHFNGKLAKGKRTLKVGDKFKIGNYHFSVDALAPSKDRRFLLSKEELYHKAIQDPETDLILAKIESEFIRIEEVKNNEN